MKSRLTLTATTAAWLVSQAGASAFVTPALNGDFDHNGIVSHTDYVEYGNAFGEPPLPPSNDMDANAALFDGYRLNFGTIGQPSYIPSVLPLSVSSMQTTEGNVRWTFTFLEVTGALAGHLNIKTDGVAVLLSQAGSEFQDNALGPIGVPGFKEDGSIAEGIFVSDNYAFAALGTTLGDSQSNVSSNLEFLTLITQGTQPTTLTFSGAYGYHDTLLNQTHDYALDGTATFGVPEPGTVQLAALCGGILALWILARAHSSLRRRFHDLIRWLTSRLASAVRLACRYSDDRESRSHVLNIISLLAASLLVLSISRSTAAETVAFTVDSSRTSIQYSGDINGTFFVVEQAPGSLITTGIGSLDVVLQPDRQSPTEIQVIRTPGDIVAATQPGTFLPDNLPAVFAGQVDLFGLFTGYGLFQLITVSIGNPAASPIMPDGSFPVQDFEVGIDSGIFVLEAPGVIPLDLFLLSGTELNQAEISGHIVRTGNELTLTIPIQVDYDFTNEGLTLNSRFTGQVVATAAVPEPNSSCIGIVGALGALLLATSPLKSFFGF